MSWWVILSSVTKVRLAMRRSTIMVLFIIFCKLIKHTDTSVKLLDVKICCLFWLVLYWFGLTDWSLTSVLIRLIGGSFRLNLLFSFTCLRFLLSLDYQFILFFILKDKLFIIFILFIFINFLILDSALLNNFIIFNLLGILNFLDFLYGLISGFLVDLLLRYNWFCRLLLHVLSQRPWPSQRLLLCIAIGCFTRTYIVLFNVIVRFNHWVLQRLSYLF